MLNRMGSSATGDITAYFQWKSNIERNEVPRRKQTMTATDLSRRLSVSTIISDLTTARQKPEDPKQRMPPNREVELISRWREVEMAELELHHTRSLHEDKMTEFDQRWRQVERGQLEVKQNLVKFNNFVREKQGKVDGGLERMKAEQEQQERRGRELEMLKEELRTLNSAKTVLAKTVKKRKIFCEYLESVVSLDHDNYKNIRTLMERCQALVGAKKKLQDHLERTEQACEEQTRELERFKEQKMGQTINYNVLLSDRQQNYSRLAAKTLERNTFLQNIEEKITEKRLLISNIKLAILNMFQYVVSRAIQLPGDRTDEDGESKTVQEMLAAIISHIVDLENVNERVQDSDATQLYLQPLLSDTSELRLDY